MSLARTLRLLLAAALLVAWQGALVHPLAHHDGHGELVHLESGHDGDSHGTADPLCAAIAAVAVVIGTGSFALADSAFGAEIAIGGRISSYPGFLRLAYLSQAPPQYS